TRERRRAAQECSRQAARVAGRPRDLSGPLRRVGVRCRHERQTDEHAWLRETVEFTTRAVRVRVRRASRRDGSAKARRHGGDHALQRWTRMTDHAPEPIRLGLAPNLAQFSLLVVVNAFVGAMIGLERTILPAIAEHEFDLAGRAAVLSFIVVFGVTKAVT